MIYNGKACIQGGSLDETLWGFWKLINNICFQGVEWKDMRSLLLKIATMLQSWSIL
jgi:hypothetical protein